MRVQLPRIQRPAELRLLRFLHYVVSSDEEAQYVLGTDLSHRPVLRSLYPLPYFVVAVALWGSFEGLARQLELHLARNIPELVLGLLLAPAEDVPVQRALVGEDLCDEFADVGDAGGGALNVARSDNPMRLRRYEGAFGVHRVFWKRQLRPL